MKKFKILLTILLLNIGVSVCSARQTYTLATTRSNNTEGQRPRTPQWQNTVTAIVDEDEITVLFLQLEGDATVIITTGHRVLYRGVEDTSGIISIQLPEDAEFPCSITVQTSRGIEYQASHCTY